MTFNQLFKNPLRSLLAGAVLWAGVTLIYTPDFGNAFLSYLIFILLLFLCLFALPRFDSDYRISYLIISSATLIVGIHAIGQYLQFLPFEFRQLYGSRATGPFTNPNHMSAFIAPCLSLVLLLLIKTSRPILSISIAVDFALGYTALVISGTRGAWFGFLVGIGVMFTFLGIWHKDLIKKNVFRLIFIFAVCTIITTLIFNPNRYRPGDEMPPEKRLKSTRELLNPARAQDYSIKERAFIWQITFAIIKSNPLLGTGFSSYDVNFEKYAKLLRSSNHDFNQTFPPIYFPRSHLFAHNEYLHIWSELGIIGLLLFLTSMAAIFIRTVQKHVLEHDINLIGFGAGSVMILVHSLVSYPLHLLPSAIFFWASIGFLLKKLDSA